MEDFVYVQVQNRSFDMEIMQNNDTLYCGTFFSKLLAKTSPLDNAKIYF